MPDTAAAIETAERLARIEAGVDEIRRSQVKLCTTMNGVIAGLHQVEIGCSARDARIVTAEGEIGLLRKAVQARKTEQRIWDLFNTAAVALGFAVGGQK